MCAHGQVSLGLNLYLAQQHTVYMSQPTYAAHPTFFSAAGLAIKTYRYYDPGTCGLDFQGRVVFPIATLSLFSFFLI